MKSPGNGLSMPEHACVQEISGPAGRSARILAVLGSPTSQRANEPTAGRLSARCLLAVPLGRDPALRFT